MGRSPVEQAIADFFGNHHDHSYPHWVPGILMVIIGVAVLRARVEQRDNLLGGCRAAQFVFWTTVLMLYLLLSSGEHFWHKIHHGAIAFAYGLTAACSILERRGYLFKGASNGVMAAAYLSSGLLLFGHPSPMVVEDRGHKMSSFCYLACSPLAFAAATVPWAHLLFAFFQTLNGFLWISLGGFWCEDVKWWGKGATTPNEHRDMMVLHLHASLGCFLCCGMLIWHLRRDKDAALAVLPNMGYVYADKDEPDIPDMIVEPGRIGYSDP